MPSASLWLSISETTTRLAVQLGASIFKPVSARESLLTRLLLRMDQPLGMALETAAAAVTGAVVKTEVTTAWMIRLRNKTPVLGCL